MVSKKRFIASFGFGFADMLISLAAMSIITVGAMKLFENVQRNTTSPYQDNQKQIQINRVIANITNQINNAITLKKSMGSVLNNKQPSSCGGEVFPNGIVPYPGFTKNMLVQQNYTSSIDPSQASLITNHSNDSVRFAYFTQESQSYMVATNPNTGLPYPTQGTNPIVLSATTANLRVGDFIMISDANGSDLARITQITQNQQGNLQLFKSATVSIWNINWASDYGISDGQAIRGGVRVQKVFVVTYAYDDSSHSLVMDDHTPDDGFDPISQTFSQPVSFAKSWTLVQDQISTFQINYITESDGTPGSETSTRTPRASEYGLSNAIVNVAAYCGNQIGKPYLHQIEVALKTPTRSYTLFATSKSSGGGGVGTEVGLEDQPPIIIEATAAGGGNGTAPSCLPPCYGSGNF